MPYIPAAQQLVHYRFTDDELASFNAFKVSMIPSQAVYEPVDNSEGTQSSKRVKTEGSILTSLPPMVCLRIFDYLVPRDLVRVVSTSKGWGERFLKDLSNQYIVLLNPLQQKTFYELLCRQANRLYLFRSIHHCCEIKKNNLIRLMVCQPRFSEGPILINKVDFLLRSTMKYFAYSSHAVNDRLAIADLRICQDTGPRQQMIAVKALEALLSGSMTMKRLTLQGLIMQMPFGFSFLEKKSFPVLEFLDLSKSNIRISHLRLILEKSPLLQELNLRKCDRLFQGDFTKISDHIRLFFLTRIDLTETAVGEEDFIALLKIAPCFERKG